VHPHAGASYVAISSSPDEVIQLVEGAIDIDVQPLRPGERFRVLVGDAELEVRGTTFTVSATEQHLVDVAVRHGRVDLRPGTGSAATLTAGQSWHAAKPSALVEPSLSRVPPASRARSVPRAAMSPSAQPSRQAAREPPAAASDDVKQAVDAMGAPVERAYDQAWAALRANDFGGAAGGFARVVLLAPDGPLVEDASFWRAVVLARGQRAVEARSAFRDFLDSFGRSPHRGEASAMLGWLLIDARSYDEAAQRFTSAAHDASPAVRRSARAGLEALARRQP
jgi:TolA-binding protein